jgi:hypothetical protein
MGNLAACVRTGISRRVATDEEEGRRGQEGAGDEEGRGVRGVGFMGAEGGHVEACIRTRGFFTS